MKKILIVLIILVLTMPVYGKKLQDYPAIGDGVAVDTDLLRIEDMSGSAGLRTKKWLLSSMKNYIEEGLTMTGTLACGAQTLSGSAVAFTGGTWDAGTIGLTTPITYFECDNIEINGNIIASTDSNGDINLSPHGTGEVVIGTGNLNYAGTAITATGLEINLLDAGSTEAIYDNASTIVFRANAASQIILEDGCLYPAVDDDVSVGKVGNEFKDAYFDGTVNCDGLTNPGTSTLTNIDNDYMAIGKSLAFDGTPENQTGAGEIDDAYAVTQITTGAGAAALTIANGATEGQIKFLYMVADGGGDATLTEAGYTLVFGDVNDGATLIWDNVNAFWRCVGVAGAVFTP